jgi:hypothetical protein
LAEKFGREPKKLKVRDGRAEFTPVTNVAGLVESAKRVRNDLLHGNKMFAYDRVRDEKLMREVLWLLESNMKKKAHIREAFDGL